jgi:hypothetical protein
MLDKFFPVNSSNSNLIKYNTSAVKYNIKGIVIFLFIFLFIIAVIKNTKRVSIIN